MSDLTAPAAAEPDSFHVELPSGFPANPIEAAVHAQFVGCPAPFAQKTWHAASARGGRDSKDVPIRSWRHHLATCWTYEQERLAAKEPPDALDEAGQSTSSVWEIQQALKLKEDRLKEMRFQHGYEEPDGRFIWDNPQNLAAAKVLKAEIKEMKARIEANVK
jgi:hypothetical protein